MANFTLELLHIADQEAGSAAVLDAPNLSAVLNALRAQDLGADGLADNTLTLSSGDAIIPGLFFDASEAVFGSAGIADIQIQNELGLQAIALGNHEFDFGTGTLAGLIDGSATGDFSALTSSALAGQDFTGTAFPYLSANLDFSADANMAPLETAGGQAPQANVVSSSTVVDVNGEMLGIVGATTPTLNSISSPGDIGISPAPFDANPTSDQLDALAAEIQTEVDALLAANPDMNKVIVLSHMQRISIEQELAARLTDVDVIVAGGSNTRLFDEDDRARDGDSDQGQYPIFVENAGDTTTAVVNTDGSYKYVGRLVIDFDEDGNIIENSYDASVSGAYATDAQGVADLNAASLVDPEIQAIADAIEAQIVATESNVFGVSDVFLNGNRSGADGDTDGVRTQETNLGNLTADANLAAAQAVDSSVLVSIKNGGGIRASIGEAIVPAGGTEAERTENQEVIDSSGTVVKPEGGISQNDIQTTLAFNNGLTLLTLTRQELRNVLEHGVSAIPGVSGRFPQVSGIEFSFDPDLEAGARIVSAEIVDADGNSLDVLVRNGALVGDADATVRIVTLGFLAAPRFDDDGNFTGGGDGYPFPNTDDPDIAAAVNPVSLEDLDGDGNDDNAFTGAATFAADGSEQDALAEYLAANFGDAANAFDAEDTTAVTDQRIQNLNYRTDSVIDPNTPTVSGTSGDDSVLGTIGDDVVLAGLGADVLNLLNGGADRIVGSLNDLLGDSIFGFGADDVLVFTGSTFGRSGLSLLPGSTIIGIDADGDGLLEGSVTLQDDFLDASGQPVGGDFMVTNVDGNTEITFETFLPTVADQVALDSSMVNGMINENFLIGDGSKSFSVSLRDFRKAGYDNALGVYEIEADGSVVDARLLFANTNDDAATTASVTGVEAGNALGFFLVQDAANWAETLTGADTLDFVDSIGDGLNLNGVSAATLRLNGADAGQEVFHSFGAHLNSDGIQHAISGVEAGGEAMTIAFEDLTGGGDLDYQDVVFTVEIA